MDNPRCPWCGRKLTRNVTKDIFLTDHYWCTCLDSGEMRHESVWEMLNDLVEPYRDVIRELAEALEGLVSASERGTQPWSSYQRIRSMGFRVCVRPPDEEV
jgi:hypothetical protein